ncbi:MAG TPA: PhzF family phenazine biosynthesis protein [Acidimicrobiales bacterium]|nr:PhzF family phenazine biosynthesis protein [Acidimicrobiales bacterium]
MRFRIVDVFTDRPLVGNALCVVLDPCPDDLQPLVAREVNLSETTFPTVTGAGAYDMRIFTPGGEIPFAGHPSIGTAWVLGPGRWLQHTRQVTVVVEADADGARMSQPDPEVVEQDPAAAVAATGLPGAHAAWRVDVAGTVHVLVATDSPLEDVRPSMNAVADVTAAAGAVGLGLFRRLDDRTVHVRVFGPGSGIPEDPGTGSAAGPVGLLARAHWGTDVDLTVRQGDEIGRPCRIEVHAEPGSVTVGGRVAACAEGRFNL